MENQDQVAMPFLDDLHYQGALVPWGDTTIPEEFVGDYSPYRVVFFVLGRIYGVGQGRLSFVRCFTLHAWLCSGSPLLHPPGISRWTAHRVLREALESEGVPWWVRWFVWAWVNFTMGRRAL